MIGLKQVRTCAGLLLATFVSQVQAQQVRTQESGMANRSIEPVSIEPSTLPSAPATSLVQSLPVITVQPGPTSKIVGPGTTVVYSVTATGATGYQWLKRPVVPFAPFVAIPGATTPTLTLSSVTASSAGAYKCIVSNASGKVSTRVVRLIVL